MSAKEIFILEDDATVRAMLSVVLTKAGYEPVCFADGDALLASARQRYPVCILLDICLPGRSGLEILNVLKQESYLSPILMISGHGSVQKALQAGRMGAVDFVEKPFKGSNLVKRIEDAIKSQNGMTEHLQPKAIGRPAFPGLRPFTKREQQIIDQILQGKSSKEIAAILKLSPRTVEDHRSSICSKADVKNTAQLLATFARERQGNNLGSD